MDNEKQQAMDAIRKVASLKLQPYREKLEEDVKKKAELKLSDLGVNPDYLKYAAGAAQLADSLQKQELEGQVDINDNLKLQGKISPREKAIKLLYKDSF